MIKTISIALLLVIASACSRIEYIETSKTPNPEWLVRCEKPLLQEYTELELVRAYLLSLERIAQCNSRLKAIEDYYKE